MARDYVSVARFDREGQMVTHGAADVHGRPDAVQFTGRSGQALVDCMGEITVTIDRWPTRTGVGMLLEADGQRGWQLVASSLYFDGIYVTKEQPARLVFSVYTALLAGRLYRLHLPNAVVTRPTIHIAAIQRNAEQVEAMRPTGRTSGVRRATPAPARSTPAAPFGPQQGTLVLP